MDGRVLSDHPRFAGIRDERHPALFVGQYFVATGVSYSQGWNPGDSLSLSPVGSGNDCCSSKLAIDRGSGCTPCFSSQKMVNACVFTLHLSYTGDANHNPYTNDNAGMMKVYPAPTTLAITLGSASMTQALRAHVMAPAISTLPRVARTLADGCDLAPARMEMRQ